MKVLRDGAKGDILSQYVRFCKLADSNRVKYGKSQKAIDETIRECMEENVLVPFLVSRKKEVLDLMVQLFDYDKILEIHDYNVALEARREGEAHGQEKGIAAMVSTLQELLVDRDTVAKKLSAKFGLLPQAAEEKVTQYWVQ